MGQVCGALLPLSHRRDRLPSLGSGVRMASSVAGDPNRGVNWFEGGRRISKLLMAVVLGIGAFILISTAGDRPTFFTAGPGEPWRLEARACQYPNDPHPASGVDVSTAGESVSLCFEALPNGKIPYAIAPEPEDAARARAQQEAADKAAIARGEPPPLRPMQSSKWYYYGNMFDDQIMSYEELRDASFRLTPEMAQRVRETSSSRLWAARREAFQSGAPYVFGVIAFIWVLTAVIGWIVRGFAGVPMDSDFRPAKRAE